MPEALVHISTERGTPLLVKLGRKASAACKITISTYFRIEGLQMVCIVYSFFLLTQFENTKSFLA